MRLTQPLAARRVCRCRDAVSRRDIGGLVVIVVAAAAETGAERRDVEFLTFERRVLLFLFRGKESDSLGVAFLVQLGDLGPGILEVAASEQIALLALIFGGQVAKLFLLLVGDLQLSDDLGGGQ